MIRLNRNSRANLMEQALASYLGLKIVFSSGYGAIECQQFQADSLPKPYDLAQLQELLFKLG